MWVGVRQRPFQTFAAEDDDKAVPFARLNDDLCVSNLFDLLREQPAKLFANGRVDPSCAAIDDNAFGIARAEVRARRHVAGPQFEAKTQRFNDTSADLVFERWVLASN